jgi:MFS family permease
MFSHFEKRETEDVIGKMENGKGKMENVSGEILLSEKPGNENPGSTILNQESNIQKNYKSIFADRIYIYFLLTLLPVTIVFFQLFGAYPIYLIRDLGFKESIYGLMMLVNTGLIIFIEVPLNNAMSHWEDKKAMALGALLCGIGFGAMAVVQSFFLIIITVVIWTFGEMIYFPATTTYASKISPKEKLGE